MTHLPLGRPPEVITTAQYHSTTLPLHELQSQALPVHETTDASLLRSARQPRFAPVAVDMRNARPKRPRSISPRSVDFSPRSSDTDPPTPPPTPPAEHEDEEEGAEKAAGHCAQAASPQDCSLPASGWSSLHSIEEVIRFSNNTLHMLAKVESWRPLSRRMAELHKANHAQNLQTWQRERMNFLQELKQNLQSEQQSWSTSMDPEIRKLCGHLQGPLMQQVGKLLKLPNRNLATKIHDGFWC